MQDGFRALMRDFPTGVAVITTTDGSGTPHGMTCSSLCSVTLDPPTLLVCLREGSPTLAAILSAGSFAVNLVHSGSCAVARLFASGRPNRFDLVQWEPAEGGPHLTRDAHAIADCRLSGTRPHGDHVVVFGQALRVTIGPPGHPPLLYGRCRYAAWPEP
ncbi:flavin reductase family protein [Amycolatopsis rhizosphaerae]|uniref:Flavin reductase family protein n=1 Tax=Amycolatopsis rhizosphaerae TaxID=2053003 RepID=A0A558CJE6_9PSEU|nr:flavin reductase family protein [Amycolatopsis rhizosphaerae]